MRKLLVVLICLLCGSTLSVNAQSGWVQERETEWTSYALPQTEFARGLAPNNSVVFRVPSEWELGQTEAGQPYIIFNGPHGAQMTVTPQTIAEGYPLTEYVALVLRMIAAENPGTSILTRRTQFQDLEAREIFFESPDNDGKMFRNTTWVTIFGPLSFSVNLLVPTEHAAAIEPLFKATVQSVMFHPSNGSEFESVRHTAFKTPAPGPIHEIQNIVAGLTELNSDREAAITRLAPLFVSQPQTVVDLLADRRAAVRSAAAEALARSNNVALKSFLWHVLDDRDPFVAEAAARRLGPQPGVISQLLARPASKNPTETAARVWPFMTKENRVKFLHGVFSQTAPDPKIQMGALTLLGTIPPDEFKFPLARVMAANHDPLTIVALEVANNRGDLLPVDTLMKLAASRNEKIKTRAIESLGQSASVSDIPKLEALLSKTAAPANPKDKEASARKALDDEIKLSIKKIRFRNDLGLTKKEQWREVIAKATSDSTLDDFAWRFDCELSVAGCAPSTPPRRLPPEFKIKPFAENLFPQRLTHYTAIPNPAQAVQRFYQTLHGLQLDSPRAQANLILVMGNLREKLGQQFGAPPDAPALIDYTGIKSDSPIVLGAWTIAGAPHSVDVAQRRAIVLRVKDRERFERLVENYQQASGMFVYLTDYLATGTRAAAALPALLPFSAQAILSADPDKPDAVPTLNYSFVGQTEWNGIPIKSIEHRWIDADSSVHNVATYLTFIGDVAILTQDLATIRDLLSNATAAEQQLLAGNEGFRRATTTDGDIVYFSDLKVVFADPENKSIDEPEKANESGALKFSNSSWENTHRFVFDESDWSRPLLTFHPKELTAPRELLPSATLAYVLLKLDVAAAAEAWPRNMSIRDKGFEIPPASWSMDFDKEVLPELGPECGAVLLELPEMRTFEGGVWATFYKLKSNKLSEAFAAGKLFHGVGPTTDTAEVKSEETSYFVAIRKGFLVVSNATKGLSALDGKTNLAATRDYSRAAEKLPAEIVAFGGYNLEAAIAAASKSPADGLRAHMAAMALSLASAFHSQSFFATAGAGAIEGRSSVSMDREGRYAVADFSYLPRGANITFATLQPHGMPILDQKRLSDIVLKVRAKAPGPIDSIRDDIKSAAQKVEQKSPNELVVTIAARRRSPDKKIQLPVTNPEVAAFVKSTGEITSDDKNVIEQARQIAADDRDAWSVARKLADWTHKNLQWKSVARAGAAETLATREADCSEFSQLYVSMARSLGLPARIVSGLAYSGNSFGGHAWVEVWIGEWVELDPTWGTEFVDATHVRNETSTLVTAAALNLIDLEVLETRRTVAEFQKSPKALTEHLVKVLAAGDKSEVEAALDLAVLTDEFMGRGAWNGLNEHERDQISSAYRRMLTEIVDGYGDEGSSNNIHFLHLDEKGDRSDALCFVSDEDMLVTLRLLRRDDVWYLVDVVQPDSGLQIGVEAFAPVVKSIEASRAGKRPAPGAVTDFIKVLTLIDSDSAKAIETVDRLLQAKPGDRSLRFLKVLALTGDEEKEPELEKLLTELTNEKPVYVPAVYRLAVLLSEAEPEKAIELYTHYSSLQPYDPRGYRDLAAVYENTKQPALAEAAYRKAIVVDPFELDGYENLISFLIHSDRVGEVGPVLVASDKYATSGDDVLASVLSQLEDDIKLADAERLAASEAQRFKTSPWANLALSDIYIREQRYREAVGIITRAIQIDPALPYGHIALSSAYLKQSRLNEALKAVEHALTLNAVDSGAHYRHATVLARLGRKKDAMTALEKSIELDPDVIMWLAHDDNFKSLRSLPAFQKLLRDAEKESAEPNP